MSRFNKNTAGNPLSEHDGYAERASIPTNDISSQQENSAGLDESLRNVTFSANH